MTGRSRQARRAGAVGVAVVGSLHRIVAGAWLATLFATQALAQDGTWTTKAPMPADRWAHAAAEVTGTLYIVGGNEGSAVSSGPTFAYDVVDDTWMTKAALPVGRSDPGTGVVNGKIYVFGGSNAFGAATSTYAYDPTNNSWTSLASMNHGRGTRFASGAVNGKLYAAGGDTSGTTEVYDPASNTWTDVALMPAPRHYVGGAVVGSVLYVVSGADSSGAVVDTVYAYDTDSNTWSTKAPLPTPRMSPAVAVID